MGYREWGRKTSCPQLKVSQNLSRKEQFREAEDEVDFMLKTMGTGDRLENWGRQEGELNGERGNITSSVGIPMA